MWPIIIVAKTKIVILKLPKNDTKNSQGSQEVISDNLIIL